MSADELLGLLKNITKEGMRVKTAEKNGRPEMVR